MVSKRKKSEMALLQQDVLPNQHMDIDARPDVAPRRSARARDKATADASKADQDTDGSKGSRTMSNGRVRRRRKNVEDAMLDLQDMEEQLRGVVKRQKLAVKSSSFMANLNDDPVKDAFTPKATRDGPELLNPAEHWEDRSGKIKAPRAAKKTTPVKSKTSSVKQEEVAQEETVGMTQEGPEEPAEPEPEDVNDIKLEGARPPPVNSDYLPLPWKGRLGYVHAAPPHTQPQAAVPNKTCL